jgi:Maltose operon periplasmic protein precursor (MalM)
MIFQYQQASCFSQALARKAAFSLWGLLLLASGCLAATTNGVFRDVNEMRFLSLSANKVTSARIDPHGQQFEFHSGTSHFLAYQIPKSEQPLLIDVVSFLNSGTSALDAKVFYPVVAILDKDLFVRRTTSLQDLRFDSPFLERTLRPAYRVSLRIDPNNDESYMVIYSPLGLFRRQGRADETQHVMDAMVGLGASNTGDIQVSVHTITN